MAVNGSVVYVAASGYGIVVIDVADPDNPVLNLAAAHADRIAMLAEGRIVACGSPRAVLDAATIARVYGQPVRVLEHPTLPVPLVVVVDA